MGVIQEAIMLPRKEKKGALICYLTAGYPDPVSFIDYFKASVEGGADIMEVGVPFSDPVADGPTIQATSLKALEMGVTPSKVFELVRKAKRVAPIPVVLMGYYNPIFRMGEEEFVRRAAEAGTNGLIVADLPLEESEDLRPICERHELDLIQLVAPTTPEARMRRIASASRGYLYLVGALGTTGSRSALDEGLPELVRKAKRAAGPTPLAVGFGVSSREQVRDIISYGADGVIVGSAILSRIAKGEKPDQIKDFVAELKSGCMG